MLAVSEALAHALGDHIDWTKLGVHVPGGNRVKSKLSIVDKTVSAVQFGSFHPSDSRLGLILETPLLASVTKLYEMPKYLGDMLIERATSLAAWHGIKIIDLDVLSDVFAGLDLTDAVPKSSYGFSQESAVIGEIYLSDVELKWQCVLPVLGWAGFGPQSVLGFGQFRVVYM